MTKQNYIQLRSQGRIDAQLAWEMYNNVYHERPKVPVEVFSQMLPVFITFTKPTMERYFAYWDQHFGVVTLIKKDGNILYY